MPDRTESDGTQVSLAYRAVSPDGKFPEGFREWPTWSGRGMDLETVTVFRDEWHPGLVLEVQETVVRPWRPVDEPVTRPGQDGAR